MTENSDLTNKVSAWTTKHGCVVQFWGMRIYYGKCTRCGHLVTGRKPDVGGGSYPKLCPPCRQAGGDRARHSMARLRRERNARRDAQFIQIGITPPRQGVPPRESNGQPVIYQHPDEDDRELMDWFEDDTP
ncbi:Uncharacterised protein [Mycolicibacterium phlei]|uniref:hypothetical protein n=1 Tax=Mycobacteroides chelonae TaxID=1774 RepID=UPI000618B6DA|nr:hypothetical protein [Mycobacteroides chelonae]VEG19455.1 Uncharacterised protein [Mycolicibacterium phlei]AKC40101.1 hypothetical protein GR01_18165 [Mycobacteroides chelonae]ANB00965.1 hypothetical protein BB28_19070 [Mycobacteroides chelonae CCUG 47445]OLT82488.1 hypothetical protein BKG56_10590 [Mycobacteroides chelonae]ORV16054.1 hypothetical protein AWB96_08685 [Mycobacteroides chelonae]